MGNYTDLELTAVIKPEFRQRIEILNQWIYTTPLYNPVITPDHRWDSSNKRRIKKDGEELKLEIYPFDDHEFFKTEQAISIIHLGGENGREAPAWSYDAQTGTLIINALFRNYWGQLQLFFQWISPFVEKVVEGEFDTDDDLEGPRYIRLEEGRLIIDRRSYTRGDYY